MKIGVLKANYGYSINKMRSPWDWYQHFCRENGEYTEDKKSWIHDK